jgi:hypothetical protein
MLEVVAVSRWRMARPGVLSEVDEQLTRLAERLRELRQVPGQPEDEMLLWCHIDLLLDERQSRWPGGAPPQLEQAVTPS